MKILLFIEYIVYSYLQTGCKSEEGSTPRVVPASLSDLQRVTKGPMSKQYIYHINTHQRETPVSAFTQHRWSHQPALRQVTNTSHLSCTQEVPFSLQ